MSKKNKENELTATERFAGKVENWLGLHARLLTIIIAVLLVVVVALVVVLSISEKSDNKKYSDLYSVEKQASELKTLDPSTDEYKSAKSTLEENANSLITSSSMKKYPAAKATMILADIAFEDGEYESALSLYSSVSDNQKKSYLGQVASFNAAVCNENLGNDEEALSIYNKLWDDYGHDGVYASHALFNVARLNEKLGRIDIAKATYEQVAGEFANTESEFAKMASSRAAQLSK